MVPAFISAILTGIFVFIFGAIIVWQNKNAFGAVFAIIGLLVSYGSYKFNKFYFGEKNQEQAENNVGNFLAVRIGLSDSEAMNNSGKKKPFQPVNQKAHDDPIQSRVNTIINKYHLQAKAFTPFEPDTLGFEWDEYLAILDKDTNSTRKRLSKTIQELSAYRYGDDIKLRCDKIREEIKIAVKNLDEPKMEKLNEELARLTAEILRKQLSAKSNKWLDTELVKSKLNLDDYSLFCYLFDENLINEISENLSIDESIVADSLFTELDPRKFIDPLELKSQSYKLYNFKIKGKMLDKIGVLIDAKKYNELCGFLFDEECKNVRNFKDIGGEFKPNVRNVYIAAKILSCIPFYIEDSSKKMTSYSVSSFTLSGYIETHNFEETPDKSADVIIWHPCSGPIFFRNFQKFPDSFKKSDLKAKIKSIDYNVNTGEMQEDEARNLIQNMIDQEKWMLTEKLLEHFK